MRHFSTFQQIWCCLCLLFISNYLVGQTEAYVPNQLLVKFKANVASAQAENTVQSLNASVVESFENLAIQQWTLPNEVSVNGQSFTNNNVTDMEALAAYMVANNENIEFAEPNYYMSSSPTTFVPDDPSFSLLWGLNNTGQTGGTPDIDIDALEAWSITTGNGNIVVGVLDSGIDWTHPDLVDNIWQNEGEDADGDGKVIEFINGEWVMDPDDINGIDDDGNGYIDDFVGWDFVDEDNNPDDLNQHGTHVAGTIAASGNNGLGVVGVSHQVKIMPLRFLNSDGVGAVSDAVKGLNYSMSKGVHLTNNSWGSTGMSESLRLAIEQAAEANQLFIAAAGNNSLDNDVVPNYPSSFDLDNIIAVAAINANGVLAGFSNYGATKVDIAAPGVAIFSTLPDNSYGGANGTSMATPHVSGAAVLLWSENLDASYSQIKNAILGSVNEAGNLSGVVATSGSLNVHQALLAMQVCTVEADFNTPTGAICPNTLQEFNNTSTDGISYAWYINDEFLMDDENAKATFEEGGEYTIKLVVTGEGEDCTNEMVKSIFVTLPPDANFNYSMGSLTVDFQSVDANENHTYQWNFGDGNNSTEESPIHEYTEAGTYEVTLAISNSCDETSFMTKTIVVEEATQALCPTVEDFTPAAQTVTSCNNPSGNTDELPNVEVGGDFAASAVLVWEQDVNDPVQVEIGENNEITLGQHTACEIGEYHFYLTILCAEDEGVILDGGSATFLVYPQPQAPTLVRDDEACNYTVQPICEFDEVSPTSIFVEQGGEAGTTDIEVSNTGCSTPSVFAVEYEACPAIVSDECPTQSDVSPTSMEIESCTNVVTLPFVEVDGEHSENAVFIWSLKGNPDFDIDLGQSPVVELPENINCEAKSYEFRLDIACSVDEGTFLEGGTVTYTLYPEPQAPEIVREDDECNYVVLKNCDSDIISMNPEDLVQAPDTPAGEIRVEVSNEGCDNPYEFFVAFEACPPLCPNEDEITTVDAHEHLCTSSEGTTVELPSIEVVGEAAENAVITWTMITPDSMEIEVPAGQSPTVTLPENTNCGYVLYEFEASVSCSKDESIVWYGGYASYEIYPKPQAPMIEMSQDEETGVCSYMVVPACDGDVVSPSELDNQNHNTPEGIAVFEVSNEGCEARTFELAIEECPAVCVLEDEFEALLVEESVCNSDTNFVTLPELVIESDNVDSAIFTWKQTDNGAPMIEVGEGANPTVILGDNKECEPVTYKFTLTITCSKDSTISYEGGTASYTLFPSPKAPTIERVDGEEQAEECKYEVIAACEGDELSEMEFSQEAGSGETLREIAVSNGGGCEVVFEVEFEECPAIPCSWKIAENEVKCNAPSYTMCVEAVDTLTEVIGINFNMSYPEGTMLADAEPSARFQFSDDLVDDVSNLASFSSVAPDGSLNVVVYLNDITTGTINGAGTLGCVEFYFVEELHNAWPEAAFSINSFQESYLLETKEMCVDDGMLTIDFDPGHELAFYVRGDENMPLTDDAENPITSIYTADEECAPTSDENALLDENGSAIIGSSDYFKATRWVGCEPLNPVVNGEDALLTAKIVARDASYTPDIYALTAADVNDNGSVDGADISLILARSVGAICSYPVQANKDTSDWKFERYEVVMEDSSWMMAPNYPYGTGDGADANNVPLMSQCHYTPEPLGDTCAYTFSSYVAVLKGDLDNTWNQDFAMMAEAPGKLVIDLEGMAASIDDNYYIPVYYNGENAVNAVDFHLSFNAEELDIEEVKLASTQNGSQINYAWNKYKEGEILLSAYTLESQINAGKPVFYLVTSTPPNAVSASSFNTNTAMLNGVPSSIEVISDELSTGIDELTASLHQIRAFPNPANDNLNLTFSSEQTIESVTYTVFDLTGRTIYQHTSTTNSGNGNMNGTAPYQVEIKTNDWMAGTYMVTAQDSQTGQFLAREKVLIVH